MANDDNLLLYGVAAAAAVGVGAYFMLNKPAGGDTGGGGGGGGGSPLTISINATPRSSMDMVISLTVTNQTDKAVAFIPHYEVWSGAGVTEWQKDGSTQTLAAHQSKSYSVITTTFDPDTYTVRGIVISPTDMQPLSQNPATQYGVAIIDDGSTTITKTPQLVAKQISDVDSGNSATAGAYLYNKPVDATGKQYKDEPIPGEYVHFALFRKDATGNYQPVSSADKTTGNDGVATWQTPKLTNLNPWSEDYKVTMTAKNGTLSSFMTFKVKGFIPLPNPDDSLVYADYVTVSAQPVKVSSPNSLKIPCTVHSNLQQTTLQYEVYCEVDDSIGRSVFIQTQSGNLLPGANINPTFYWNSPPKGTYTVKVGVVDSFADPNNPVIYGRQVNVVVTI